MLEVTRNITSIEDTQALSQEILSTNRRIILLTGNLGAGKTTLTQYIAQNLGITGITSPTFSICNVYEFDNRTLYHLDLYRLKSVEELSNIGFEEIVFDESSIVVIEWPDLAIDIIRTLRLEDSCVRVNISRNNSTQ